MTHETGRSRVLPGVKLEGRGVTEESDCRWGANTPPLKDSRELRLLPTGFQWVRYSGDKPPRRSRQASAWRGRLNFGPWELVRGAKHESSVTASSADHDPNWMEVRLILGTMLSNKGVRVKRDTPATTNPVVPKSQNPPSKLTVAELQIPLSLVT